MFMFILAMAAAEVSVGLALILQLYHQLEHYFHAGQAESEHTRLIKMLEKVRQEERHAGLDR